MNMIYLKKKKKKKTHKLCNKKRKDMLVKSQPLQSVHLNPYRLYNLFKLPLKPLV